MRRRAGCAFGAGAGLARAVGGGSRFGILRGRGLELDFPLENAGAGGGGFSLGDVARGLKGDGEGGVGERVGGGEDSEGEGRGDGGF